jgi:hypothetical protein
VTHFIVPSSSCRVDLDAPISAVKMRPTLRSQAPGGPEDPNQPVQARERDQDEDDVVERVPDPLEELVQDVDVRDELAPGEGTDQEKHERDPV